MTAQETRSFTIVSFDRTKDAATLEAAEDRSLNLLLRRKRVRSEIYRLPVLPDDAQVAYLREILAAGPRRAMIFLLRDAAAVPAQLQAVARLSTVGTTASFFFIGDAGPSVAPFGDLDVRLMPVETSDAMQALAEELLAR